MITARIVVLLAVAVTWGSGCTLAPSGGHPWNYHDFDDWENQPDSDSSCGEEDKQQSPIDLYGDECGDGSNQPRVRLNKGKWKVNVTNNGRTLKIMFDCFGETAKNGAHGPLTLFFSHPDNDDEVESIEYDMAEWHFHWGQSEHALEGMKYPAETHIKWKHEEHRGTAYHHAKLSEGALLAVGVLLTDDEDDADIKLPTFGLEHKIKKVRKFNKSFSKTIKIKPLKKFLNRAFEKVYKYMGSLTTPPCTLKLPWLVAAEPAKVKSKLLKELKKLRDENGNHIKHNYRPLQKHTDELKLCLHDGEDSEDNEVDEHGYHYYGGH